MNENTQNIDFKGIKFEVQADLNKSIYSVIEGDANFYTGKEQDSLITLYVDNRERFLSTGVINFLTQAGVDFTKENEIYRSDIGDNLIISGWFDIIGKILEGEKTGTLFWDNDDSTTNVGFSNDQAYGIRKEFKPFNTFRLSFDIVFAIG